MHALSRQLAEHVQQASGDMEKKGVGRGSKSFQRERKRERDRERERERKREIEGERDMRHPLWGTPMFLCGCGTHKDAQVSL